MIKNIIKQSYPIIFSCMYLFCLAFFISYAFLVEFYEISLELGIISVLLAFISTISILIEMVVYMVHAGKSKEINNGLWIVLIYMLNVFIIPYYNLKYICKAKNIKIKTVIYAIFLVLSCILGFLSIKNFSKEIIIETITFKTHDERVSFTTKDSYIEKVVGEYDLYLKDEYNQINIGVFTYDLDNYDTTPYKVLSEQENYIITTRDNVKYKDGTSKVYNDKKITTHVYSGEKDGTECIYRFSTIEFNNDSNYFIYVIQITLSSQYSNQKDELIEILESTKLNINSI